MLEGEGGLESILWIPRDDCAAYVFMELKTNGGDKVKIIINFSNFSDGHNTVFKRLTKSPLVEVEFYLV